MRILFLGNNNLGLCVLRWLKEQGEQVCGVVIHPPQRQRHTAEILGVADLPGDRVFDGSRLAEEAVLDRIRRLEPILGVSVMFGYVLRPAFLDLLGNGCVNLHPAFLPFNRGAYPNVWSIVERTPAGVTLHFVDAGIDTGPIIAQKEVPVDPVDTGESLYHRLELEAFDLFKSAWPSVRAGKAPRRGQPSSAGTSHRARDVESIDHIELDGTYRARDLIDILRARTFSPHPGAYFTVGGRRVYVRLELSYPDGDQGSKG